MKFAIICIILLFTASGAFAGSFDVVVSVLPQRWLMKQLAGDYVHTHVLLGKGQEPHSFEPSPHQIAQLYGARLFFEVGLAFEQVLLSRIGHDGSGPQVVDVTSSIHKIQITGKTAPAGTSGLDPHVWLCPENLLIMATVMAKSLEQVDPGHGPDYQHNLMKLKSTLEQLDNTIKSMLAPLRGATFYVFHPAFGYFAYAYGLHQQAVEISGKSPSPRSLMALIRKARLAGVKVVFVQPQFDPKSSQAIADALSGAVVPLDPLAEDVATNLVVMARRIHSALSRD